MKLGFDFSNIYLLIITFVVISYLCFLYFRYYIPNKPIVFILRILVLVLLLFVFLKPKMIFYEKHKGREKIVFAIDTSYSMNSGIEVSRLNKIIDFLHSDSVNKLKQKYDILYYSFSNSIKKIKLEDLRECEYKCTNIQKCIEDILEDTKHEKIAAIYLFSDGNNTSSKYDGEFLSDVNIPIYTVGLDSNKLPMDISINSPVTYTKFFKDMDSEIQVDVRGYNVLGKKINVYLKQNNKVLQIKSVEFGEDNQMISLNFNIAPHELGEANYTIETDKLKDELNYKNNICYIHAEVVKNKIRILYLCGAPGSEYRFLREVLKSDPIMEIVSFVILRKLGTIDPISENELSLIPFPSKEIFTKEIFKFDLFIIENFSYMNILNNTYLKNIKSFVEDYGKSLLILGGGNSFSNGGYKSTPLDDIMPVVLDRNTEKINKDFFKLKILDYSHPIMNLEQDFYDNKNVWDKMPKLQGLVEVKAKEGANVLASNPNVADNEGKNYPVILEWKKKKGLVMCFTNNTTWRWSFNYDTALKTNYYQKFWLKTIDYLVNPEKFKTVNLIVASDEIIVGDNISFRLDVNRKIFDNLKDKVSVFVDIKNLENHITNTLSFYLDAAGNQDVFVKEFFFIPEYEGKYEVFVRIMKDGSIITDKINFYAKIDPKELIDVREMDNVLQDISRRTNGKFYLINEINKSNIFPARIAKTKNNILREKNIFSSPYLFFLILCIFIIELYIRRKSGLQ
jgi:hypothetical protein